jgi:hypothetical protein
MNPDSKPMTCHQFQDQLADLIGSGADPASHSHVATCGKCRSLLEELESISDAARRGIPVPEKEEW